MTGEIELTKDAFNQFAESAKKAQSKLATSLQDCGTTPELLFRAMPLIMPYDKEMSSQIKEVQAQLDKDQLSGKDIVYVLTEQEMRGLITKDGNALRMGVEQLEAYAESQLMPLTGHYYRTFGGSPLLTLR